MTKYDLIIRDALALFDGRDPVICDVACSNGTIERIDSAIDARAAKEIRADGNLLIPGVIDAQVHFRDPGNTHKEDLASGSRAAVSGGVTSFLEMPNTSPPTIDQNALDNKLARAAECSVANYGFFIGATSDNLDSINNAHPACGIKIFMGSSTGTLLVYEDEHLDNIFANGNRLIAVHAEDEQRLRERQQMFVGDGTNKLDVAMHSEIRDDICALLATERAVRLSRKYNRRLHVLHLTSAREVEFLRQNKTSHITVECTPNHLFMTVQDYERLQSRAQMNPPIRSAHDQQTLWEGLHDGTIDFIATDHAPHTRQEKDQPYPASPSGMPGVETSLPLMLTACLMDNKCSLQDILKWMCMGPAQAYRIPNKGKIEVGYDADLAICDIENSRPVEDNRLFTKVKWSPFSGKELIGWPKWTVVGGKIAFADSKICEDTRGSQIKFET